MSESPTPEELIAVQKQSVDNQARGLIALMGQSKGVRFGSVPSRLREILKTKDETSKLGENFQLLHELRDQVHRAIALKEHRDRLA